MKTLAAAISLAAEYHKGALCLDGTPYILHPLKVASHVEGEAAKIVAVCHDLLEDTDCSVETLRDLLGDQNLDQYTPDDVLQAIILLTKEELSKFDIRSSHERYMDYIRLLNIRSGPAAELACKVKIQDLTHNMDISRIPKTHPMYAYILRKICITYHAAYMLLAHGVEMRTTTC